MLFWGSLACLEQHKLNMNLILGICNNWYLGFKLQLFYIAFLHFIYYVFVCLLHDHLVVASTRVEAKMVHPGIEKLSN